MQQDMEGAQLLLELQSTEKGREGLTNEANRPRLRRDTERSRESENKKEET